ncbi:hypothetical protein [Streptomyces sp. NPDC054784]
MTASAADTHGRVRAVRQLYARRGERPTARDRAYALYVAALLLLVYAVPLVHRAATSPPLLSVDSPATAGPAACLLAVVCVGGALLAGRFWGPLVLKPFLLHTFASTDLPPALWLGSYARRRLAYAGPATLLALGAAAFLVTDVFDDPGGVLVSQGVAYGLGVAALVPVTWLWAQVRTVRECLAFALGAVAVAAGTALLGRVLPAGDGALGPVAGVLGVSAAVVGRSAFRSLRTVELARLVRESARAAEAQTFAWTGTLHHALDLYRPEPRGFTSALLRPDGRLRGHLAQGAVRACRAPGRAVAAAVFLPVGGIVTTLGVAAPDARLATSTWLAGAAAVYWGAGWVGENWRGLRDELTLAPLLGEWWGGVLARTLAWPLVAVTTVTGTAAGATLLARHPDGGRAIAGTALLVAGTIALVLGGRFLREMKTHLPPELLLPIITPLGDLSGLRVFAWQFDGLVAVLFGVLVMNAVPTAVGGAALAVAVSACFVWSGLRRTGWAHPGLLTRLRRV